MAEEIKICKLIIKDFEQFKDIELDFTDPKTGEPLDKICLIGRNGAGKSKLLKIIEGVLFNSGKRLHDTSTYAKLKIGSTYFYYLNNFKNKNAFLPGEFYLKDTLENEDEWLRNADFAKFEVRKKYQIGINDEIDSYSQAVEKLQSNTKQNFLLTVCPSEDAHNALVNLNDVPTTSLASALELFNRNEYHNVVSSASVNQFWNQLIFLTEKYRQEKEAFSKKEENQNRTVKEVFEEFDKSHPKILEGLSVEWNKILEKAGLEFDVANAQTPIHLTDNLRAYIRLKGSENRINYNALSTGIRNFIFKIGHIYSLYFDREVTSGVLLLDEPENSLFPDFLYDLIDIYQQATTDKRGVNNTQLFVATHNPIIAAQFKPEERILLEFDDSGGVTARRGITPEGDDPNDILRKDFQVRSLLGKEGVKNWERYLELKRKLRANGVSKEDGNEWRKEFMKIGESYNFGV